MHKTKFVHREEVAEGTMKFSFERPRGFHYQAGQSVDLILVDPPETDGEGNKRAFSLASAPHEDTLYIVTRLRDTAFKRVLKAMRPGTALSLDGPFGSFTLHENKRRPAIFLAGGIGVTPFHSIITDAIVRKLPHKLALFYSNRRPEDAPFLEEFAALARAHPSFTFIPTMTQMEQSKVAWSGEQGYIDAEMLSDRLPRLPKRAKPIYYLAGPHAMVAAMRKAVSGMGVSNDDIRTEEFTGY